MAQQIKFGYWGIRGLGQVSRLLLAYTEANWQNINYTDPNQWFAKDKQNLGLNFPNLPYLIDGDLKLTQSSAIKRYIIQISDKKQLLGKNAADSARVTQLLGVLDDINKQIQPLMKDLDYQTKLKQTWEKVKPKFQGLQKFIGQKQFALGYLTLADFDIAEWSNYFQKVFPQEFKQCPSLARIRDNLNNLQLIKNYYARQDAVKGPFLPAGFAIQI